MSKEDNPENNNKASETVPNTAETVAKQTSGAGLEELPDEISLTEENDIESSDLPEENPEDNIEEDGDELDSDFQDDISEDNDLEDSELNMEDSEEIATEDNLSDETDFQDEPTDETSSLEEFDSVDHIEAVSEEEISNKYQTELDATIDGEQLDSLTRNNPNAPTANKPVEPEKPEVDNSLSKIASSNSGSIAIVVIGLLLISFIIYNSYKETKKQNEPNDPAGINPTLHTITPPPPVASDQIAQPQMPKLPETPEIQVPTLVQNNNNNGSTAGNTLAPPTIPSVSGLGIPSSPPTVNKEFPESKSVPPSIANANLPPTAPTGTVINQSKANMAARYKTNMVAFGGQVSNAASGTGSGSSAVLAKTASQVTATTMGDLTKLIAQGKLIDGVLESAISTDLPGMVRAIVSRDTYAESGKNILIPKGSRLIGTYSASVQNGQARVQITWSRMMRPDGVDIALNSPSVDSVGRTGVIGNYEGRGLEQFTSALMVSALNYGMAALQDKQNQREGVSTGGSVIMGGQTIPNASVNNSNPNGSMVVTTNPTTQKSQALTTASSQISSIAQTLANNYYQVQPRITIDQGAKIKVFVQQDLIFPGQPYNSISVVN